MQRLREVIRGSLARSLRTLTEEDRLAAALPVVCGTALAAHCEVLHLDGERTLHLQVDAAEWMATLMGMRDLLQHDLQRVAGVPLTGLHFVDANAERGRRLRSPPGERSQAVPGDGGVARRPGPTSRNNTRKGRSA